MERSFTMKEKLEEDLKEKIELEPNEPEQEFRPQNFINLVTNSKPESCILQMMRLHQKRTLGTQR